MAGYTDWPMRRLSYAQKAQYACSEMVSAMGYMTTKTGNLAYEQLLATHPEETNTACQIFGKDPQVMAEATHRITALNRFSAIDINMGCPARKIVQGGEGSALLKEPELAYRIMQAVKSHTHLPVMLKTRLGFDEDSMNALTLVRMAESLGFETVCIHGRTQKQQYSGRADHDAIAHIVQQVKIPIWANGDVTTASQAKQVLAQTGAKGLLIGRGAMGNPWLFRDLQAGKEMPVSLAERLHTATLHCQWLAELKGERLGVLEMRKHLAHYIAGFPGAGALRRAINGTTSLQALLDVLHHAFEEETKEACL